MSTAPHYRIQGRLLAAVLWFSAAVGIAQETNSAWLVRSWQSDEGLPENSVESLAQTSDGFIWVGARSGLARFDGLRFESCSLTNVVATPNRGVMRMLRGKSGTLWLAMDRGGVVHLKGRASQAFTQGLPNGIPYDLAEDGESSLWISYRGGAVYCVKDGVITEYNEQQGVSSGSFCALATDNQGRLWLAKAGQIGRVCEGRFQVLHNLGSPPTRLAASRSGGVWVCSGIKLYKCAEDGELTDMGSFQPPGSDTVVTALIEDREGSVWIGSSFGGLYRHDDSGFTFVSGTHRRVTSLLEDFEGNIWVGTTGGGLNRIRPRAITLETDDSGLPFPALQSICESTNGNLWAVTQSGDLIHRENGRWANLPKSSDWPGGATCITADRQDSIWIGRSGGLACWRLGKFLPPDVPPGVQGKTFHTVLVSTSGDLWLGQTSPNALLRLRAGQLKTFALPADSRIIRAMAEDDAGNIWAGTSKGTLFRIAGEQLVEATPRSASELAPIRCLYATADGTLWIGYAGWGVGCVKDGRYSEFALGQGLHDNYISQIVADGRGWIWFGANRGLFKVREQDFHKVIAGRAARVQSVSYGRDEGLPSLQAAFGCAPTVSRSRDGRLWFPMQTGLAVVDADKLSRQPEPPPVWLSRVTVDDRLEAEYAGILPHQPGAKNEITDLAAASPALQLPPGNRRIEIVFAALNYSGPENVQFRYRLKGLDDKWVDTGTQRSVIYSRLAAGEYVFEMTACNSDGNWNQTGAALRLVVHPFYWQTWWFRLGVLAAIVAGIVTIVRYVSFRRLQRRLRTLEQQAALQKERTRIAKDIHDDLGADLTQIAYLGELARMDCAEPDRASERIVKMSATARQAIKSLDEIVWAVNPRNDTLSHLIDYTCQFTLDYLRLAGIRVRLDYPEQIPPRKLVADLRHNSFLSVKEALHNIVKHADATEVWLRAVVTERSLEISVEDNGRGFVAAPDDALADGLRNMRQRMAGIGGECRIDSRPGQGTRLVLHLPWPEEPEI